MMEAVPSRSQLESEDVEVQPMQEETMGCMHSGSFNEEKESMEEMMKMEFSTVSDAHALYNRYVHRIGLGTRIMYERRCSKTGKVQYMKYVCNKEGFRRGSKFDPKNSKANANHIEARPASERRRWEERTGCQAQIRLQLDQARSVYVINGWVVDHNHSLHSKEFAHMLRSNRHVSDVQGVVAELNKDAGIQLRSSYEVMALSAGGKASLSFLSTDLKNHLARRRQKAMVLGEATALQEYFRDEAYRSPAFYYDIEVDNEEQIANIFWADGRMKMDYDFFGDSISFDTTYRTNKNYRHVGLL